MKKWLTVLITGMLLLAMFSSAALGEGVNVNLFAVQTDHTQPYVLSSLAIGDTLYMLITDSQTNAVTLRRWKQGMDEPEIVLDGLTHVSSEEENGKNTNAEMLFTDGSSLYSFCDMFSTVKLLVDETGAVVNTNALYELDRSGVTVDEGDYVNMGTVQNLFAMGDTLYMLTVTYETGERYVLTSYNLQTGEVAKQQEYPKLRSLAPYKDGKLLAMWRTQESDFDEQTETLLPYDIVEFSPDTGAVTVIGTSMDYGDTGLVYSQTNNAIYYVSGSVVYKLQDGQTTASAYLSQGVNQGNAGCCSLLSGQSFVYSQAYDGIAIRALDSDAASKGALVIAGDYNYDMNNAVIAEHPEMAVTMADDYFDGIEALTNAMLSGSDAFDMVLLSTKYEPLEKLIQKGYAADLSAYREIADVVAAMDENLTKCVYGNGKLYGLPVSISGTTFAVNRSAWTETLGLSLGELPKTYMELLDFIANYQYDYGDDHPELNLLLNPGYRSALLSDIIDRYVAYQMKTEGIVTFDTPLMRKLLTALEAIDFRELDPYEEAGEAFWNDAEAQQEFWEKETLLYPDDMSVTDISSLCNETSEYAFVSLPLDEGLEPVFPVSMNVMIVNPRTTRMDMAVSYLNEYMKHYEAHTSNVVLFPANNQSVPNPAYEAELSQSQEYVEELKAQLEAADAENQAELRDSLKYAEEALEWTKKRQYLVTAEEIATYRTQIAPYLYVLEQTPLSDWSTESSVELQTLMQQYASHAITMDTFVREVDKRVRMMMLEDQ